MAHFYYHHHQPHPAPAAPALESSHVSHHYRGHAAPAPAPTPAPAPAPRHHRAPARPHVRPHATAPAALDPVLTYHTHPTLEFDVTLSPAHIMLAQQSNARSSSSYANLTPRHLSAPAVVPPQPFLRITCALLRWPIDVYPASRSGSNVVTVGDVLNAIYRELRQLVQGSDWHSASPETQEGVRTAYKRRCRRQHSHAERMHEEARGLRRVDWLMKNTLFQGLRPGKSPDHWEMHVRPGEKSVKFALAA